MTFYKEIAKHYTKLFKITDEQIGFIEQHIGNPPRTVIDIACGDGGHAIELAKKGYIVTALDSTPEMLESAREKADLQGVEIATLNCKMDEMNTCITGQFDAAICLGNALVHLDTRERIVMFLKQLKATLTDEGQAIIQIMNYDRLLTQEEYHFPTIENLEDDLSFERSYQRDNTKNKILFHTKLKVKDEIIKNTIELVPLTTQLFREVVEQAGLTLAEVYGGYDGSAFNKEDSYHYITILRK